jgi:hypothetical protein
MKQIAFRHESFSEELAQSDTLYSVNVALPTSLGAGKQCPDNRSNNADFETELDDSPARSGNGTPPALSYR